MNVIDLVAVGHGELGVNSPRPKKNVTFRVCPQRLAAVAATGL